jgi:hypothetical protein
MNKTKTVILGLMASVLTISAANGQGLLGERYVDVNGGYERLKVSEPGDSWTLDGWGAGAALNFPLLLQPGQFGLDLLAGADYVRVTDSGVTFTATQIGASLRGYVPLQQAIKPFAGVGLDYFRAKISASGFGSESDSSIYVPLEVGVEFVSGPFSLTPFFSYSFATESDWDDYWTVGAKGAYWFGNGWGATLSVSYTDFDDDIELLGIRGGLIFSF